MKKQDFYIGLEFFTGSGKWRCTDVGSRVIVAIKLDKDDPSWYNGPPYAVVESVFDEYDVEGCSLEKNSDRRSSKFKNGGQRPPLNKL